MSCIQIPVYHRQNLLFHHNIVLYFVLASWQFDKYIFINFYGDYSFLGIQGLLAVLLQMMEEFSWSMKRCMPQQIGKQFVSDANYVNLLHQVMFVFHSDSKHILFKRAYNCALAPPEANATDILVFHTKDYLILARAIQYYTASSSQVEISHAISKNISSKHHKSKKITRQSLTNRLFSKQLSLDRFYHLLSARKFVLAFLSITHLLEQSPLRQETFARFSVISLPPINKSMHKIQINRNQRTYCQALQTENQYQSVNLSSFHKAYRSIKIKYLKHKFLANISRSNTHSRPHIFQLKQKQSKLLGCSGWYINQTFTNVLLLLDVLFTLVNFILSAFQAFLVDYQAFKLEHPSISGLNICAIVIYLCRIGLSLISIEVENGIQFVFIVDIVKKQVLRGRFFVQLSFTAIVLAVVLNANPDHDIQLGVIFFNLCIPKLYVLTQSFYKIEVWLINTLKRRRYWDLLKILLYNIFLAHFIASIILATLYFGKERNWYDTKPFAPQNIGWLELYLWAYYWACTMMITVGFGDFVPANVEEAVVVSFLQIMSSIIIAYNISQIGSIIQEITQGNHQVNSKIGLLRRMNKENTVSRQVNLKIEQYIVNEVKIEEEFEYLKHHGLINSLPEQLQTEYYREAQKNIFGKLPFLVSLSTETLINFFMQLSGKVYYPEEYVMRNHNNQEITILLKGTIGFCCRKSDSLLSKAMIETLKINYSSHKAMLLNNSLLNRNQGVDFDIKAVKYSYAIKFTFETFISILKQNQKDYHFYLMTLDAYQLQNSITIQKCQYCSFSFHNKFQCPKLHFMPFKSIVISKYNENASFCNARVKLFYNKSIRRNKIRHSYLFKESFREHSSAAFIHHQQWHSYNLIKIVSNKLLSVNLEDFEVVSQEFQELDQLFDFQFYFPRWNPSRLKGAAIQKKMFQSKRGQKQKRVISEISMVLS